VVYYGNMETPIPENANGRKMLLLEHGSKKKVVQCLIYEA
jgi:hypothetical protein